MNPIDPFTSGYTQRNPLVQSERTSSSESPPAIPTNWPDIESFVRQTIEVTCKEREKTISTLLPTHRNLSNDLSHAQQRLDELGMIIMELAPLYDQIGSLEISIEEKAEDREVLGKKIELLEKNRKEIINSL